MVQAMAYIRVDEFVNRCKNVLMARHVVKCVWTVFFDPG